MKKIVFYSIDDSSSCDSCVSYFDTLDLVRNHLYSVIDVLLDNSDHVQISILFSPEKKPIIFDFHVHNLSILENSDF